MRNAPGSSRQLSIENDLQGIYTLLGYEISSQKDLAFDLIDFVCEAIVPGAGHTKLAIHDCHYSEMTPSLINSFHRELESYRHELGSVTGVLISKQDFTPKLRSCAAALHNLVLKTFQDLYDDVFHFRNYLRAAVAEYERTDLFSDYIPLLARTQDEEAANIESSQQLKDHFEQWLNGRTAPQMCLLGDFGSGKTTFLKFMHYSMATQYLAGAITRIPLFLPLNRYAACLDTADIVSRFLTYDLGVRVPHDIFFDLLRSGRFLFLLDGFDEMGSAADTKLRRLNYIKLVPFMVEQSKVLISCRPAYFVSQAEMNDVFGYLDSQLGFSPAKTRGEKRPIQKYLALTQALQKSAGRTSLTELMHSVTAALRSTVTIYLQLLTRSQISQYLQHYNYQIHELSNGHYDWQAIEQLIADVYDLEDLASRPILLKLIVDTLPLFVKRADGVYQVELEGQVESFAEITPSRLYFFYTEQELIRESQRRPDLPVLDRTAKRTFIQALAFRLLQSNTAVMDMSMFIEAVRQRFHPKEELLAGIATDIHSCSFLIRDAQDHFGFTHKSFMEYFAAVHVLALMTDLTAAKRTLGSLTLTEEVLYFLGDLLLTVAPGLIGLFHELETIYGDDTASKNIRFNVINTLIFARQARSEVSKLNITGLYYVKQQLLSLSLEALGAEFVKLRRCRIRRLKIAESKIKQLELRGSGLMSDANIDSIELMAVCSNNSVFTGSRFSLEAVTCDLGNIDLKQTHIVQGRVSKCSLNFREIQGSALKDVRFIDCVVTASDESALRDITCEGVLFEQCVFFDLDCEQQWFSMAQFINCTFIRCTMRTNEGIQRLKGNRGIFLRTRMVEPTFGGSGSIRQAPFAQAGFPFIYSYEQAMKPVRYPEDVSSWEGVLARTFPADGPPLRGVSREWVWKHLAEVGDAASRMRQTKSHRHAYDRRNWSDEELLAQIKKAEKAIENKDAFEAPDAYNALAQLFTAKSQVSKSEERLDYRNRALSLCGRVLDTWPSDHDATCLTAQLTGDAAIEDYGKNTKDYRRAVERALKAAQAAMLNLRSCPFAIIRYLDVVIENKLLRRKAIEEAVAQHESVLFSGESWQESAIVDWGSTLLEHGKSVGSPEGEILAQRALLRFSLVLRANRQNSSALAGFRGVKLYSSKASLPSRFSVSIRSKADLQ